MKPAPRLQNPDPAKRDAILAAATDLFGKRPYHEVRLDDIAAAAKLGKGTVYLYFDSKDDLYSELIVDAFRRLLSKLESHVEASHGRRAWPVFESLVRDVAEFAGRYPNGFMLMRDREGKGNPELQRLRRQVAAVIERAIRRGVEQGEMNDAHPELTAQFVFGCIRAAMRFGPAKVDVGMIADHVVRVLAGGIRRKGRDAK